MLNMQRDVTCKMYCMLVHPGGLFNLYFLPLLNFLFFSHHGKFFLAQNEGQKMIVLYTTLHLLNDFSYALLCGLYDSVPSF